MKTDTMEDFSDWLALNDPDDEEEDVHILIRWWSNDRDGERQTLTLPIEDRQEAEV
jgi:hypothetical protein